MEPSTLNIRLILLRQGGENLLSALLFSPNLVQTKVYINGIPCELVQRVIIAPQYLYVFSTSPIIHTDIYLSIYGAPLFAKRQ